MKVFLRLDEAYSGLILIFYPGAPFFVALNCLFSAHGGILGGKRIKEPRIIKKKEINKVLKPHFLTFEPKLPTAPGLGGMGVRRTEKAAGSYSRVDSLGKAAVFHQAYLSARKIRQALSSPRLLNAAGAHLKNTPPGVKLDYGLFVNPGIKAEAEGKR